MGLTDTGNFLGYLEKEERQKKKKLSHIFSISDLEAARARQREVESRLASVRLKNEEVGGRLIKAEETAAALDQEYFDGIQSLKMSIFDTMKLGIVQVIQRLKLPFQVGAQFNEIGEQQYIVFLPTDTPLPGLELDLG